MLVETLAEGWALGLATGVVCLSSCSYIYASCIGLEKRTLLNSLSVVFQISIGRFVSYFIFGLAAGYFGGKVNADYRQLLTAVSFLVLPIIMLYMTLKGSKTETCSIKKASGLFNISKYPVLIGIATGINFCPSFLIALSNSFSTGGALSGGIFFIAFFFGTSVFLLPIAFVGMLTHIKKFNVAAKYASVIIAIWFFYKAGVELRGYYENVYKPHNGETVQFLHEKKLYAIGNDKAVRAVAAKIVAEHNTIVVELPLDSIPKVKDNELAIIAAYKDSLEITRVLEKLSKKGYSFLIDSSVDADSGSHIDALYSYLHYYAFMKGDNGFSFVYKRE